MPCHCTSSQPLFQISLVLAERLRAVILFKNPSWGFAISGSFIIMSTLTTRTRPKRELIVVKSEGMPGDRCANKVCAMWPALFLFGVPRSKRCGGPWRLLLIWHKTFIWQTLLVLVVYMVTMIAYTWVAPEYEKGRKKEKRKEGDIIRKNIRHKRVVIFFFYLWKRHQTSIAPAEQ